MSPSWHRLLQMPRTPRPYEPAGLARETDPRTPPSRPAERGWRSRPQSALVVGAALVVLAGGVCAGCDRSLRAPTRPNVVLVSIDTLRADHLSCYGYHRETSPFLDSFARTAALFRNAYAQTAFTLTSHMSLFTSTYPNTHGVTKKRSLPKRAPLLAELLQDAGYATAAFHSARWLDPAYGFSRGFDRYEKHGGGIQTESTVLPLFETFAGRNDPFFLFLHFFEVHGGNLREVGVPYYNRAPPEVRDRFVPYPEVDVTRHRGEDIKFDRVQLTDREIANIVAHYDGGILYLDSILKRIFTAMQKAGIYESTLIVVTSDHGEALGDHGTFKGHGHLWENGLRIPLIVKLPDSHPQSTSWTGVEFLHRVQSVDIAPTILKVAGIRVPATFQGLDLFDRRDREVVGGGGFVSVLVRGRYKLWYAPWNQDSRVYDLASDPGETAPLDNDGLLHDMRKGLQALHTESRKLSRSLSASESEEARRVELSSEALGQLEALGYVVK